MYKFRKAIWHSIDLDKIYNCTRRGKEEAIKTELQTDYIAPATHEESTKKGRPGKPTTLRK